MEYKTKITFGEGKNKVILMTDTNVNHMIDMIGGISTEHTMLLVNTLLCWFLDKDIAQKGSLSDIVPGLRIAYTEYN